MKELECRQCGYCWYPRVGEPKKCPECQSRKWRTGVVSRRVVGVETAAVAVVIPDESEEWGWTVVCEHCGGNYQAGEPAPRVKRCDSCEGNQHSPSRYECEQCRLYS